MQNLGEADLYEILKHLLQRQICKGERLFAPTKIEMVAENDKYQ